MRRVLVPMIAVLVLVILTLCGKISDAEMMKTGRDYALNGDYQKAIANYELLLNRHRESQLRAEALCRLGLLNLAVLDDKEEAATYFRMTTEAHPETSIGEGCRAMLEFMKTEMAQSREEVMYRSGLAYANLVQDYDMGVNMLQRVIDEFPASGRSAESLFMIGFIYANSAADTAKARAVYSRFLEQYPDHELIPSVEWEIEHLGKDINEIPEIKELNGEKPQ